MRVSALAKGQTEQQRAGSHREPEGVRGGSRDQAKSQERTSLRGTQSISLRSQKGSPICQCCTRSPQARQVLYRERPALDFHLRDSVAKLRALAKAAGRQRLRGKPQSGTQQVKHPARSLAPAHSPSLS